MNRKFTNTISVIIPAYNEAKTIDRVIHEVLKLHEVKELIIVDDGSTDKTKEKLKVFKGDPRFIYTFHIKNRGKGAALRTGIKKAKKDIILLLDADLMNITVAKIRKIINPVLKDEVDIARAGFRLARGRVTEIAVKPMMSILFPHLKFDQPISGQICAKKSFLEKISLENRWGVDIGILLDAIQIGARMVEINIGKLEHKARTDNEKAVMAQQVLEIMIKKAGLIQHKYKLVTFGLNNILLPESSLRIILTKLNIYNETNDLKQKLDNDKIDYREYTKQVALLFKNKKNDEIEKICSTVPLVKYSEEVIGSLKKRRYQVAIISANFSPIVKSFAKRLGINQIDAIFLEEKNGVLTGEITPSSIEKWLNRPADQALERSLTRLIQRTKVKLVETVSVAQGDSSTLMLTNVGLGIAYWSQSRRINEIAVKTIKILPEILAIIE